VLSDRVRTWLLDPVEPSIRYRTLTELLDRPPDGPEVREARAQLGTTGWVPQLLAGRGPEGGWTADAGGSQYRPKYLATNWKMLALSDLAVDRSDPEIARSCEHWFAGFPLANGGLGGNSKGTGHHCVVGNLARAAIRFGYAEDPRVRRSLDWLVETADPKGGWSCFGSGRNLDSWEGLSAFAAFPRERWTGRDREVVERAAEFFLERELHRQGGRYAPWFRFHWPVHYYYDLLVGLELLTALGYGGDPRLRPALEHLRSRRRADGRWELDATHPDLDAARARWFTAHPKERPTPLALERPGSPSRMITLRALLVLKRVEAPSVVPPRPPAGRGGRVSPVGRRS
jgi:hypothetical protein